MTLASRRQLKELQYQTEASKWESKSEFNIITLSKNIKFLWRTKKEEKLILNSLCANILAI